MNFGFCFLFLDSSYCLSSLLVVIKNLLSGTFVLSAIGAFAGAAGGAYAIMKIERKKENHKLLSSINYNSAALVGHINTLLGMKRQAFIPLAEEVKHVDGLIQSRKKGEVTDLTVIKLMMQLFPEIDDQFMIDFNKISEYCHISTRPVEFAVRAKEALASISNRINQRNEILEELRNDPRDANVKIPVYFDLYPESEDKDQRLRSLSIALINDTDAALWFMLKAQKELHSLGEKALPKKLRKQLAKFEFTEERKRFLPPDNYLEWKS